MKRGLTVLIVVSPFVVLGGPPGIDLVELLALDMVIGVKVIGSCAAAKATRPEAKRKDSSFMLER
jgi:hypothetical protein